MTKYFQNPRTKHNWELSIDDKEINLSPSKTIQGESYTIQELLKKHASGNMPDIERNGVYQDDENIDSMDMEKYQRLDLADRQRIASQNAESIIQKEQAIKAKHAKKATSENEVKAKAKEQAKQKEPVPSGTEPAKEPEETQKL